MNEPSPVSSSLRTCVGCGKRADRGTLIGLQFEPVSAPAEGDRRGNPGGEAFALTLPGVGRRPGGGRGVHVHGKVACLQGAVRKGLPRVLRRPVRLSADELLSRVGQALRAEVTETLVAARRQKALGPAGGATDAPVLWIHAIDARAAGLHEASIGQVQAGTQRQLGALLNQPEMPVIALSHRQLASRLQKACALASAVAIGGLEVG